VTPACDALLATAAAKLRAADLLIAEGLPDDAASRAYYAAFHAMSMLDDQTYADVLTKVRDFAKSQLAIITLDRADFQRAAALCDQWQLGLRAGDALHIAIAEQRDLTVCTLDRISGTRPQ
jgi:hypothetical protein